MCGGYYEEEMMEEKYYGPSTQFHSTPTFGRAAAICELENIACRLDAYSNTIHFEDAKAEERFSIAWRKAVAGSQWKS